MSAVEDLTYQGFARVGPEQWKNNIKHVETKVEHHFWTADNLQEEYVQEFIIAVGMELDTWDEESGDSDESEDSLAVTLNELL